MHLPYLMLLDEVLYINLYYQYSLVIIFNMLLYYISLF